jgi:hypothetical protein
MLPVGECTLVPTDLLIPLTPIIAFHFPEATCGVS